MPLEERHKAAKLAEWLEDVFAKFYSPPQRIRTAVHDNRSNSVAAVKILEEGLRLGQDLLFNILRRVN